MSDILKTFLEQTYGSLEKAKEADKQADLNPRSNPQLEKDLDDKLRQQLGSRILLQKNIKDSVNIPTRLKEGELDSKTQRHPNFKDYDHSLEEHRGHKLGLIKLHVADESQELPSGGIEDMIDNMFNGDSNLVE